MCRILEFSEKTLRSILFLINSLPLKEYRNHILPIAICWKVFFWNNAEQLMID